MTDLDQTEIISTDQSLTEPNSIVCSFCLHKLKFQLNCLLKESIVTSSKRY